MTACRSDLRAYSSDCLSVRKAWFTSGTGALHGTREGGGFESSEVFSRARILCVAERGDFKLRFSNSNNYLHIFFCLVGPKRRWGGCLTRVFKNAMGRIVLKSPGGDLMNLFFINGKNITAGYCRKKTRKNQCGVV